MTPILLTDNPIPDGSGDEFGFRDHAEQLCAAVLASPDLPLTLAVFGPWGSGKSSFLNICRDRITRQGAVTVAFSPWKYDKRDEVWHALLQTLLNELITVAAAEIEPSDRQRFKSILARVGRLSLSASWLVARQVLATVSGGLVSADDLEALRKQAGQEWSAPAPAPEYGWVNGFERDFAGVVRELTGETRRLVVFIDDLDRCRPETALSVLEALRIFTGDAPCVFVIAMDQTALVDAAADQFGGDRVRGRWYLEKLLNFAYHLPAVRYESLLSSLRPRLSFLPDDAVLWEVIRVSFENNPRRVRRFVSSLNLTLAMLTRTGPQSPERMRQVAILLMLRQEHPEYFAALKDNPGTWSTPTVEDPRLNRTLDAISTPARGFDFPPAPSADLLTLLTDVLVLGPLTDGQDQ